MSDELDNIHGTYNVQLAFTTFLSLSFLLNQMATSTERITIHVTQQLIEPKPGMRALTTFDTEEFGLCSCRNQTISIKSKI